MSPIKLDLRTALHDIPDDIEPSDACLYTAPCIIGRMMTPEQRLAIADEDLDSSFVSTLIAAKVLIVPEEQIEDFSALQNANDRAARGDDYGDALLEVVAQLKEKYK